MPVHCAACSLLTLWRVLQVITRPIPKPVTTIIQREVKILADLGDGHLNIVHADEVLLSRTHVGLVMEYVPGGCLPAWGMLLSLA
jgi:hypothetical protein